MSFYYCPMVNFSLLSFSEICNMQNVQFAKSLSILNLMDIKVFFSNILIHIFVFPIAKLLNFRKYYYYYYFYNYYPKLIFWSVLFRKGWKKDQDGGRPLLLNFTFHKYLGICFSFRLWQLHVRIQPPQQQFLTLRKCQLLNPIWQILRSIWGWVCWDIRLRVFYVCGIYDRLLPSPVLGGKRHICLFQRTGL